MDDESSRINIEIAKEFAMKYCSPVKRAESLSAQEAAWEMFKYLEKDKAEQIEKDEQDAATQREEQKIEDGADHIEHDSRSNDFGTSDDPFKKFKFKSPSSPKGLVAMIRDRVMVVGVSGGVALASGVYSQSGVAVSNVKEIHTKIDEVILPNGSKGAWNLSFIPDSLVTKFFPTAFNSNMQSTSMNPTSSNGSTSTAATAAAATTATASAATAEKSNTAEAAAAEAAAETATATEEAAAAEATATQETATTAETATAAETGVKTETAEATATEEAAAPQENQSPGDLPEPSIPPVIDPPKVTEVNPK